MTDLLMAVGIVVFFISVYGAVMTGGHLLEQLELQSDVVRDESNRQPTLRDGDGDIAARSSSIAT